MKNKEVSEQKQEWWDKQIGQCEDALLVAEKRLQELSIIEPSKEDIEKMSPEEVKKFIIDSALQHCLDILLHAFVLSECEQYIEAMCTNDATSKNYVLTFQTEELFKKRFYPIKVAEPMNNEVSEQPVRIVRSRKHKQVSPNGLPIVYVGRPGKWGNPFKIRGQEGHWFVLNDNDEPLVTFDKKDEAIDFCVENYREYISHEHNLGIVNVFELKGKNLSCWCPKDSKCHADVLLKLANS